MILAALMCYTVSLAAQQIPDDIEALRINRLNHYDHSYTVKLDSIKNGGWSR